jgi:hypothetical protein
MTTLLHVSPYLGHLQECGYPRKVWWPVMQYIYSYNIKVQVLNTINDKSLNLEIDYICFEAP